MNIRPGFIKRLGAGFLLAFGLAGGSRGGAASSEVLRVPMVAVDGRVAVAGGLSPADIEVFADGRKVETFLLAKRQVGQAQAGRVVFLVFDSLSTTHAWLSRAKSIAERLLDSSGPGIEYLLLSLEPGTGLTYLLGPSSDRAEIARVLRRKIVARQAGPAQNGGPRRLSRDDNQLVEDPRTPRPTFGETLTERDPVSFRRAEWDERKKGEVFLASLATLNIALTGFQGSLKTVCLFSGGIASRVSYQDLSNTNANLRGEVQTIDSLFLNSLSGLADIFKTRGALVFVVNPAGVQIGRDETGSGENQLRLLAERGGGRYLEGEPETIMRQLTEMESAFCEVVWTHDAAGGAPIDIEIKPKDPALRLYYGRRVFPARGFEHLGREEKMRLALDAAEGGYASRMALSARPIELLAKFEDRQRVQFRLRLPEDMKNSPLEIFRVWIGRGERGSIVDLERLTPSGDEITISMDKKKGCRSRLVIIEPRTTAALIIP